MENCSPLSRSRQVPRKRCSNFLVCLLWRMRLQKLSSSVQQEKNFQGNFFVGLPWVYSIQIWAINRSWLSWAIYSEIAYNNPLSHLLSSLDSESFPLKMGWQSRAESSLTIYKGVCENAALLYFFRALRFSSSLRSNLSFWWINRTVLMIFLFSSDLTISPFISF